MSTIKLLAIIFVAILSITSQVGAVVGVGIHYGADFSLSMDSDFDSPIKLTNSNFNTGTMLDSLKSSSGSSELSKIDSILTSLGYDTDSLYNSISGNSNVSTALPFSLSRSDWSRSIINFGGKVYVDIIPVIDAIEVSFNIGAWEYKSTLKYPVGVKSITQSDVEAFVNTGNYGNIFVMDSIPITLDEMGISYLKMFGISQTPLLKMNFDLTIRKNLVAVPKKMKIFKLYLGGGPSVYISTPVLTPKFVADFIKDAVENSNNNLSMLNSALTGDNNKLMKDLLDKLRDSKSPTFGLHLIAGTMIKIPVIPIGFYANAKFQIPFTALDDNVDIGGKGFLLNGGITFAF